MVIFFCEVAHPHKLVWVFCCNTIPFPKIEGNLTSANNVIAKNIKLAKTNIIFMYILFASILTILFIIYSVSSYSLMIHYSFNVQTQDSLIIFFPFFASILIIFSPGCKRMLFQITRLYLSRFIFPIFFPFT